MQGRPAVFAGGAILVWAGSAPAPTGGSIGWLDLRSGDVRIGPVADVLVDVLGTGGVSVWRLTSPVP